jgi:hypothetical protein
MARTPSRPGAGPPDWIEIGGFKCLQAPQRIHLRPLTVFAGGNSSGKSSVMQALLLLKQTLEAPYDPGPLLLDGPHARFTDLDQVFSRGRRKVDQAREFTISFGPSGNEPSVELTFRRGKKTFELATPGLALTSAGRRTDITATSRPLEVLGHLQREVGALEADDLQLRLRTDRFSSRIFWLPAQRSNLSEINRRLPNLGVIPSWDPMAAHYPWLASIFHLPGLRGHRDRLYEAARIGTGRGQLTLVGPFLPYTAALVANWREHSPAKLKALGKAMETLGLTWKVEARQVDTSHVELKVGRMPGPQQGGAQDLVDIADVGFGVSQVLPVVVALLAAEPGQVVYIEQPELHLHPRAQMALGRLLAEAAARGVRVVVETHSRMILRAVQVAVGRGDIRPDLVGLHWFCRDPETGMSTVRLADLQADGSFGDWPVDFSEAEDEADEAFLEAAVGT